MTNTANLQDKTPAELEFDRVLEECAQLRAEMREEADALYAIGTEEARQWAKRLRMKATIWERKDREAVEYFDGKRSHPLEGLLPA